MNYNNLAKDFGVKLFEALKNDLTPEDIKNKSLDVSQILTQFIKASYAFVKTLAKLCGIPEEDMNSDFIEGYKKLTSEIDLGKDQYE